MAWSTTVGMIGPWCGTTSYSTLTSPVLVPNTPISMVSVRFSIGTWPPSCATQSRLASPGHGAMASRYTSLTSW